MSLSYLEKKTGEREREREREREVEVEVVALYMKLIQVCLETYYSKALPLSEMHWFLKGVVFLVKNHDNPLDLNEGMFSSEKIDF